MDEDSEGSHSFWRNWEEERKHLRKLISSWILLNCLELFSTECTLPNEFDLCVHNALVLPWMTVQSSTKVEYWS